MKESTRPIITTSDAVQDFGMVARLADRDGEVYLYEDGKPKYRLVDVDNDPSIAMTDDEKIDFVAAQVLKEYRIAFEELAK